MADIPGLIEGAHKGVGLGQDFLRHIDRTAILVFVIDLSGTERADPISDFEVLIRELELYDAALISRPRVVVGNKIDLPSAREHLEAASKHFQQRKQLFFPISAVTGEGVESLLYAVAHELGRVEKGEESKRKTKHQVIKFSPTVQKEYSVQRTENGTFKVRGEYIERLVTMTDLENDEAVVHLQKKLVKLGVEERLLEAGAQAGDIIKIAEMEFDFEPG